jgi:hypothetical protein
MDQLDTNGTLRDRRMRGSQDLLIICRACALVGSQGRLVRIISPTFVNEYRLTVSASHHHHRPIRMI